MLGSDQNVSSVLIVLAVWVALQYAKESLPIDVLTAVPDEIPRLAILMGLQESSLVLDCVRYVLFGPKRKFCAHFPCMLGRSTTVRQGISPDQRSNSISWWNHWFCNTCMFTGASPCVWLRLICLVQTETEVPSSYPFWLCAYHCVRQRIPPDQCSNGLSWFNHLFCNPYIFTEVFFSVWWRPLCLVQTET